MCVCVCVCVCVFGWVGLGWVLWHVSYCSLCNAKSCYIYIYIYI